MLTILWYAELFVFNCPISPGDAISLDCSKSIKVSSVHLDGILIGLVLKIDLFHGNTRFRGILMLYVTFIVSLLSLTFSFLI